MKPLQAPQSVKIKIKLIFIIIQLSVMQGAGRVKNHPNMHTFVPCIFH